MAARIMVINDTQEILELFREILTLEGYEVVLYSFAVHDMAEVERQQPDLIILDYIFGAEKTGWQMLQKLKMRRSTASIPVVICSAAKRDLEELQGHLTAMGVGVVLKPFNVDMLLDVVRQTLEKGAQQPGAVHDGSADQGES